MGIAYNPSITTNSMVSCWDIRNVKSYPGSGTTITDLTGNNLNPGLVGSVSYLNGYLYNFSQSNYITLSNLPTPGTGDFTYGFWIYLTSLASSSTLLHIYNPSTTFIIRANFSSNSVYVNFSSTEFALNFGSSLAINNWYNIVVTRSVSTVTAYLNGNASTTNGTSSLSITGSTTEFGRLSIASGQHLLGYLAAFSAYNRTIPQDEVRQNFNALKGRYGV